MAAFTSTEWLTIPYFFATATNLFWFKHAKVLSTELSDLCNDRQKGVDVDQEYARQRQNVTEELKRSDAFSPTTFKNTPKTIISSNSNFVQISVSQWLDFTTIWTLCSTRDVLCWFAPICLVESKSISFWTTLFIVKLYTYNINKQHYQQRKSKQQYTKKNRQDKVAGYTIYYTQWLSQCR